MESHHSAMNVLLLTQEQCGFCTQAKEIMDRLAVEYQLSISMLDLGSPEGEALAVRSGILFPPGIFLDGEPFSYGRPSERKLRREIERRLGPVQSGSRILPSDQE
jgi:glutaredoxin